MVKQQTFSHERYRRTRILHIMFYSSITGIVVGLFLYLFKTIAHWTVEQTITIYEFVINNPLYIPLLFLGLAVLAFFIFLLVRHEENTRGGAIARAGGVLKGLITFRWLRVLLITFASSLIGFFAGLPVGVEGPSVIMGTSLGDGVYKTGKVRPSLRKYVQTSGAAAGFSVATGSSFAGVLFALEEMHKRFSFTLVITALSGATFSTIVVRVLDSIFGTSGVFLPIGVIEVLPIKYIWITAIIGIFAGVMAGLFNSIIFKSGDFVNKRLVKVPLYVKILINLLLVGVVGLFVIQTVGNGHSLILEVIDNKYLWPMLLILLVSKLVLITVTTHSGTTGGLFVPVLVIGALSGGVINQLFLAAGLDPMYTKIVVLLTMCAFFGASMNAPLTTIVFMLEATLDANHILYFLVAVFFAMVVSMVLKLTPLNEGVLERILKRRDHNKEFFIYEASCELKDGCFILGQSARDVLWPSNLIIKAIKRAESEKGARMVKGGDKVFLPCDHIVFQFQAEKIDHLIPELEDLFGKQDFNIKKI